MKKLFFIITVLLSTSMMAQELSRIYTPEQFGANGFDNLPDDQAWQMMFDAVPDKLSDLWIECDPGAEYIFENPVRYPKYSNRRTTISGNNCTISTLGNVSDLLIPGKYWDNSTKQLENLEGVSVAVANETFDFFTIRDVRFLGGNIQLRVAATWNALIENCHFNSGNYGCDIIFGLGTSIQHCWFNQFNKRGIILRTGQPDGTDLQMEPYFANSSATNSQSNMSEIHGCRIFSNRDGNIGVFISASSNIDIQRCSFEGLRSKYMIYADYRGSTTAVSIQMKNIHLERPNSFLYGDALIYLRGYPTVILETVFSQYGRIPQMKTENIGAVHCLYWPAYGGGGFHTDGSGKYRFVEMHGLTPQQILDESLWVNGYPQNIIVEDDGIIRSLKSTVGLFSGDQQLYLSNSGRLFFEGIQDVKWLDQKSFSNGLNIGDFLIKDMINVFVTDPTTGKTETLGWPLLKRK